ncbi:MAG: amidohydrolase family protein, partial [Bdellovibrionota bacterium]
GDYTKSVSQNMNPWIQFGKPIECAAFRWSELQAMVIGTTYLQGPSGCVENFGIQRVEDGASYISQKDSVQAPTDLIYPNEMQFVWKELRPAIAAGKSYEQALADSVNKHCPGLPGIAANTVNEMSGLKILKDQALLKKSCPEPLPEKFVRYVYWIHPTIAGKKKYIMSPTRSAVIAHLAEGRRQDPYNMREIELIRMLGLDQPKMNFVHGVGIAPGQLQNLAKKDIGLIWSPFSNLLLYGETLDILSAHNAGVTMSLGSDWLPTGSKGTLEEAKLAAQYVDKNPQLKAVFNDEYIYKMMTENPAKMINHWDIKMDSTGKPIEAGVGQIAKGAMGTVIVATLQNGNPYTNLVRQTLEENINLVVIDGNVIYGNEDYVKQAGISNYEYMSKEYVGIESSVNRGSIPVPPEDGTKESSAQHLKQLGAMAASMNPSTNGTCQFATEKVLVHATTVNAIPELATFERGSRINLDRFSDIEKLLALNALSQSKNWTDKKVGDPKFALTYFPPMYSCNDARHTGRIRGMVKGQGSDEWSANVAGRTALRAQQKLGKGPQGLGAAYK